MLPGGAHRPRDRSVPEQMLHPPRPDRVALYAHIPFCVKTCPYCSFYSHVLDDPSLTRTLADRILAEARHYRRQKPWADQRALSLYLGGGTPSLLPPDVLRDLIVGLRETFPFEPDAEVTVEMNPGTLRDETVRAWVDAGVTRVSFGVQSLGENTLRRLGRNHSADEARATMRALREAAAFEISADLILAVAADDAMDEWRATVDEIAGWGADHISAYALIVEGGTPFARMQARGTVVRLDNDTEFEQAAYLRSVLEPAGYRQYEISNWALPGRHSRHNSAYWDGGSYLSFGPSAHAYDATRGRRFWNVADTLSYIRRVDQQGHAVSGEERLTARQLLEERILLVLRLIEGGTEDEFKRLAEAAGVGWPPPVIDPLLAGGYLERRGERLRCSRDGLWLSDEIAARISAALEDRKDRDR